MHGGSGQGGHRRRIDAGLQYLRRDGPDCVGGPLPIDSQGERRLAVRWRRDGPRRGGRICGRRITRRATRRARASRRAWRRGRAWDAVVHDNARARTWGSLVPRALCQVLGANTGLFYWIPTRKVLASHHAPADPPPTRGTRLRLPAPSLGGGSCRLCLYTIAFGCAARFFRDGDVGDATTLPPSMTSPCRDRELCCALALLEVQRGWTGRHVRGAHIPRHQRQPRTFSRARAQRRGREWAGRAQHPWATMARGLAVQWQWFGAKVRGQGSAVASGTRAVAGHYHRRRDASRSGSTRDQERCTPRSLCRAGWQS